ncbi:MAG: AtpZ/AtpI family protein [Gelidibacter sp.]
MQQPPKKENSLNNYAKYSAIAFQMFAIIGIGSFIGVKIDEYYGNENKLWTIILSLCSTILAVVFVIRRIIANSKDDK